MTELERLQQLNFKLVFILGATLPLLMEFQSHSPRADDLRVWIINAIESVIYNDGEPPEMPK